MGPNSVQATAHRLLVFVLLLLGSCPEVAVGAVAPRQNTSPLTRERLSLNAGWRFQRFTSNPDNLSYSKLKAWILPSASSYIKDASSRALRPAGQPTNVTYAQATFDDKSWDALNLPHDWAVKGPFYTGSNAVIGGGMGRLPIQGVGWYRKKFTLTSTDQGKGIFLEVDGAMSYVMVWLNGNFVGGWPYGYASFQLDLTSYVQQGDNQLAIRLENAVDSSRFYPGAGIYRNVWLTKVSTTHVQYHGTWISSRQVSEESATLDLVVQVENTGSASQTDLQIATDIHVFQGGKIGEKVGQFPTAKVQVGSAKTASVNSSVTLSNPRLWGPKPSQTPNLYVAVTRVLSNNQTIDEYTTRFGIRSVQYTADGVKVNGERIYLQGVCQHHDLGSIGSAFIVSAAKRQLEMLQEMGSNAVRTSHNPPAPELLDLADEMGFLILDEIFDTWNSGKRTNDFHLIFPDWHEADLRSFIRRDRNHPSVVMWSYGNEVAEQRSSSGANTARMLQDILHEEDPTRLGTIAMDNATPTSAITSVVDIIGLNYQGEGRGTGQPTFPNFRSAFPNKMIFSTESSSGISTRGTYLFPVTSSNSATEDDTPGNGGDANNSYVSSYDLYAVSWGASPDKVFVSQDKYPYVGGEFVWTGWDYIGEPTPYDSSRSSYFGIIDLAGFPKDRYYLYQSRWNPTVRMAHILPHWNWPERVGLVTPVHVFSSADKAELFLNGVSQGVVNKKAPSDYRFRWDKVTYQPGKLEVVTYKNGSFWANATVATTGDATQLKLSSYKNRDSIRGDGNDLAFISVGVSDKDGNVVPRTDPSISFSVQGPGEIVSTDNGNPTDFVPFPSKERKAFGGLALAIVRATGESGTITVTATSKGLTTGTFTLKVV
ncbi:glycoside hydrolase superfamily [Echria macrotheca]|uniref:Glycoside hydrolase superfamily n=1 Tax=Echria macrotheca TaxID=438768 RepID=A0AAJ0F6Q1_9PEZI|nr:glycoside hydrolase superfamily [Echria macrotheca]